MSPPDEERRPGIGGGVPDGHGDATSETTVASQPPIVVVATAYRPDGRRTRWLVVLDVCPSCSLPHMFYGSRTRPARLRSCGGRVYQLHSLYGGKSDPPEMA